jgi:hypothetical protein
MEMRGFEIETERGHDARDSEKETRKPGRWRTFSWVHGFLLILDRDPETTGFRNRASLSERGIDG